MDTEDTIIAIATAQSDAGIGIIRISGRDALQCADRVCTDASGSHTLLHRAPNTIRFAHVLDGSGGMIDEALVSVMRAPYSYTGEDVVEINVHGGRLAMEQTLKRVLEAGKEVPDCKVRLAEPGEFTKRAFLNGKKDLSQAEAVQDLIAAQNSFAFENAAKQLRGVLKDEINALRSEILHETAFLEAAMDDPDVYGEELDTFRPRLRKTLDRITEQIGRILQSAEEGIIRKEGIRCAIIGFPNAGKSTLLNALLKEDRAIVSAHPGTTRDVISEKAQVGSWTLLLFDTAGIRRTTDEAETQGVARAKQSAKDADLIFLVADSSAGDLNQAKEELLPLCADKNVIVLLNKTDLIDGKTLDETLQNWRHILSPKAKVLPVSLLTGKGLDLLEEAIPALLLGQHAAPKTEYYLTNERHRQALLSAKDALELVREALDAGVPEDLYTVDLTNAYDALSAVLGESVGDDLIDEIFSSFCMGK